MAEPEAFTDAVRRLVREYDVRVIFPTTEEATLALLPHREDLGALLPLPSLEQFIAINDKAALLVRAAEIGIAVPRQHVLEAPDTALPDDITFPVVVKPSRSVPLRAVVRRKLAAEHAATRDELNAVISAAPAEAYPLLVQQRIVGPGVGLFFLCWDGVVIARFAHRRLREKPPQGGVSVLSESTTASSDLEAAALRLISAQADWRGLAMVEFKCDSATQTPYLMEVNARVWGSIQLAIDSGVDFPRLLVDCALGTASSEPTVGKAGHRLRWWFGDLDHLLTRLKNDCGFGSRVRAIATFIGGGRGARNEILRVDDWRPALREALDWIRGR